VQARSYHSVSIAIHPVACCNLVFPKPTPPRTKRGLAPPELITRWRHVLLSLDPCYWLPLREFQVVFMFFENASASGGWSRWRDGPNTSLTSPQIRRGFFICFSGSLSPERLGSLSPREVTSPYSPAAPHH